MTLLEAFKEVGKALNLDVRLAELDEANYGIEVTDLPLLLIMPYEPVNTKTPIGFESESADITAFLLVKQDDSTIEYKAEDIEINIQVPLREVARKFRRRMDAHEVVKSTNNLGIETLTMTPVFGQLDEHMHGIQLAFTIPFIENPSTCI